VEARRLAGVVAGLAEALADEYAGACTGCGVCSHVCPVYLASRDPRLTPAARIRAAVKLLREGRLGEEEVRALFTCTCCGACTLACPFRLSPWLLLLLARYIAAEKGYAPGSLLRAREAARRSLHSFTADPEAARRWLSSVEYSEAGDYLYVPTPVENYFYTRQAAVKVKLFRLLGIPAAVSGEAIDLGGNMAVDLACIDAAARALEKVFEEADKAGARWIIVSECGSDIKWSMELSRVIMEDTLSRRDLGRLIHIHEVLYKYLERSGLRVARAGRAGLFTSCTAGRLKPWIYRRFTRRLVEASVEEVYEPRWRGRYVACCGGSCLNVVREKWARGLRIAIGTSRIAAYPTDTIIVPCTKCYISFRQSLLAARRRDKRIELVSTTLYTALAKGQV